MEVEITVDGGAWDSGLGDTVILPTAKKAIELYADIVISEGELDVEIDNHKVRMMRNDVLERDLFKLMHPETRKAEYMINVEVGIKTDQLVFPASAKGTRWFVGIYYRFKNGEWVEEDDLKQLNSYEMVAPISGGPMEVKPALLTIGGESTVIGQYRPELGLADSKRLLLEKGAEPELNVNCPLCKTEELIKDDKFAPPGIYWYWNSSYINGFWTGHTEAHKEAREIVTEWVEDITIIRDALKKHDEKYGNCTIPRK